MIEQVIMWKTRDGQTHSSEHSAGWHEQRLDQLDAGNTVLFNGGTIFDACLAAGYNMPAEALEEFTQKDKLIISHWQCHDDPAYTVCRFELRGIFCHGVGGWSGAYGDHVSISDLGRYATGTLAKRSKGVAA